MDSDKFLPCNPYFCDGQHGSTRITAEKVEKLLKAYLNRTHIGLIVGVLFDFDPELISTIAFLARDISRPNVTSSGNKPALQVFQEKMKISLTRNLAFPDCKKIPNYFQLYLVNIALWYDFIPCLNRLNRFLSDQGSEAGFSLFGGMTSLNMISNMIQTGLQLNNLSLRPIKAGQRCWNSQDNTIFLESVSVELINLLEKILHSSLITKWFDYVFAITSATRLFEIAYHVREMTRLNKLEESSVGEGEMFHDSPGFFQTTLIFWMKIQPIVPLKEAELIGLKETADKLAALKKYKEAIERYELINFVSLIPNDPSRLLKLQSLTNCAALRLRTSKESPRQILPAIQECTWALAIDPNHTKALFRRGLTLALCKKWREAIVDFERALELDPLSPAQKELEVARRQVKRRIGN